MYVLLIIIVIFCFFNYHYYYICCMYITINSANSHWIPLNYNEKSDEIHHHEINLANHWTPPCIVFSYVHQLSDLPGTVE